MLEPTQNDEAAFYSSLVTWTRAGEDNRLLQLSALYPPAFSIGGGGPGDPAAGIGPGWASELA